MSNHNVDHVTAGGFTRDKAGKLRVAGKLVGQSVAPFVEAGTIRVIDRAAIEALKKGRTKAAKSVGDDEMLAAIRSISPAIEFIQPNMETTVDIPDMSKKRSFIMGITSKLTNLTFKGKPWAGRQFEVLADDASKRVYILRYDDIEPRERKLINGTGKRGPNKPKGAAENTGLQEALAKSRQHLNGGEGKVETETKAEAPTEQPKAQEGGEKPIIIKH